MGRRTIVGVTLATMLAAVPLAAHAATAPSVTIQSPTSGSATSGELDISWTYNGFYRTTPIDIEVAVGDGPFQRVARTVVDDGTPGYSGSYTLATDGLADGTDYTVRLLMPTRRSVTSAVSPITIDNTGPTSTVTAEPVTDPAPATSITADVEGTADDAISAVSSVLMTFTTSSGAETVREAACECGTTSVTWSVSTAGLTPGSYTVSAVATDALGNAGEAASADMVIVGTPDDPTPALVEAATTTAAAAVETATTVTQAAIETATTTTEGLIESLTTTPTAGGAVETATTTTEALIEAATTTTTAAEVVETVTTTAGGAGGGGA